MPHKVVRFEDLTELPLMARKLFSRFYNVASESISDPRDHERFNDFVRHCHARRIKFSEGSMRRMLERIGSTSDQARSLSEIYFYGRSLLSKGKAWE